MIRSTPSRSFGAPAVILMALLVAACGSIWPSPVSVGDPPVGDAPDGGSAPPLIGAAEPTPTVATPVPEPGHEVYGFVPYWEMDEGIADHVAKTDLTTLALFSVTHRRSGELATNQNGYKRITGPVGSQMIRQAHDRGERVELVYTSFGETKNRRFYSEPESRERWIRELVALVAELGLDGINVDVELLPAEHVAGYGAFVGELRDALRAEVPDGQVSVATTAGERGAAMAAAAVGAGADRVFLMGYDYHWAGSDPGASAPIDRLDGATKDLVWTLDTYAAAGVPVERTLLGLPLYGMTWPTLGPGIGSPATGRGDAWVPRWNLSVFDDPDFEPTYEPVESVEFYAVTADGQRPVTEPAEEGIGAGEVGSPDELGNGPEPGAAEVSADPDDTEWSAVYFDSPRSLTPKLALADARGLAGAGFWAIGYERGLPEYTDLIARFRAGELAGT
jgi:hypothetical protein